MHRVGVALVLVGLVSLSSASSAALLPEPVVAGDCRNLAVRDTETGLTWLNLWATVGLSHDDLVNGVGNDWFGDGWRYATGAEICALFARYARAPEACPGTTGGPGFSDYPESAGVEELVRLLGQTRAIYDDQSTAYGVYDDDGASSAVVGRSGVAQLHILPSGPGTVVGRSIVWSGHIADADPGSHGHYLVRAGFTSVTPNRPIGFSGIGDVLGGSFKSVVYGLSADGTTAVGWSDSAEGPSAFRWRAGAIEALGDFAGGRFDSEARGASCDGAVVVGRGSSASRLQGFRWAGGGTGLVPLALAGEYWEAETRLFATSADGSAAVGRGTQSDLQSPAAIYWSSSGGIIQLSNIQLAGSSVLEGLAATGISPDGNMVVGYMPSGHFTAAFLWRRGAGIALLGDLPGGSVESTAHAISAGSPIVVVGRSSVGDGQSVFRWDSAGGMVDLGDLPGGIHSSIGYGVSADGSLVVGQATSATGFEAFVWDQTRGLRSLKSVLLSDFAIDAAGWSLSEARAISADGRTIVGNGTNPDGAEEAWIVTVPSGFAQ